MSMEQENYPTPVDVLRGVIDEWKLDVVAIDLELSQTSGNTDYSELLVEQRGYFLGKIAQYEGELEEPRNTF